MTEYNILVGDKTYKVELIKENEDFFEAKLNEKPMKIRISPGKQQDPSSFTVTISGQEYKITTTKVTRRTPFQVTVNNTQFNVQLSKVIPKTTINTALPNKPAIQLPHSPRPEEGAVVAPMAGKIITIKVKQGDHVNTGDPICTLEAMKMENEITATKTGKIHEIHVSEGSPVNERALIATIE
jgi:pyruvate carboxylase subunit B